MAELSPELTIHANLNKTFWLPTATLLVRKEDVNQTVAVLKELMDMELGKGKTNGTQVFLSDSHEKKLER